MTSEHEISSHLEARKGHRLVEQLHLEPILTDECNGMMIVAYENSQQLRVNAGGQTYLPSTGS